jgi:RHS repeat-associated protein
LESVKDEALLSQAQERRPDRAGKHNLGEPEHITGTIDDLYCYHTGNQLAQISDASSDNQNFIGGQDFKINTEDESDYLYDVNGNMISDMPKKIVTIRYNYLNLPDTVQMRNGSYYSCLWDGSGNKSRTWHRTYYGSTPTMPIGATMVTNPLSYTSASSVMTDYYENFVYERECLRRFFFDDGIVLNTSTSTAPTATPSLLYHYYLKDHLGNNRVVFHEESRGAVIDQVNNYYPFGMEYGEEAEDQNEVTYQNHLYSGKEFDNKFQMNSYDFRARTYSVDVPVWRTPDPMSEKYYSISPYAYCANNPISIIDPNGEDLIKVIVPANADASKTKAILVDSKAAAQFSRFIWEMNSKYGLVVISHFRSKSKQAEMRDRWDRGEKEGLAHQPAAKSAHSGGFAVDLNVRFLGLTKNNCSTSKNKKIMNELSKTAAQYGFSYGGDYNTPDVPHFYLDETDFGYESRDEAMEVNDEYMKEHGDEIPTYNEKAANADNDSNSSALIWDHILNLMDSWLLQNPNIIVSQ